MKDYFTFIISKDVTGMTDVTTNTNDHAKQRVAQHDANNVTANSICDTHDTFNKVSCPVMGSLSSYHPNKPSMDGDFSAVTGVTCKKIDNEHFKERYEERAAIYQFDGQHSKAMAEHLGYRDVFLEYVTAAYPDVARQFEGVILKDI